MQTWQANFKGDLVISNSEITIQTGLQEVRLFQLSKTQSAKDLISLIALQITDLIEFIGLSGKMSAKQIFDTAEFILDDYASFSLMALQHCFNLIKKSEPPFDEKLYNSISGKKIIEWLRRYDKLVDDFIFADANKKIEYDKYRSFDRQRNSGDKLLGISGALGHLKNQIKNNK